MPLQYVRPPHPELLTTSYQLVLDLTTASPRVAETPTIGYPYELSKLVVSSDTASVVRLLFSLLVATERWTAGATRDGQLLHQLTGDDLSGVAHNFLYVTSAPLTLRPRIRVNQPGTHLRLVHDIAAVAASLRVQCFLTPLG